jgi:hypothetical protein
MERQVFAEILAELERRSDTLKSLCPEGCKITLSNSGEYILVKKSKNKICDIISHK